MGRQSSRLIFQGKDHKDIYYQGHYHDAMYLGNQLLWEKLYGKLEPVLYEDITTEIPEEHKKIHVKDMISTVYGKVVFKCNNMEDLGKNGSACLAPYDVAISGTNTAVIRDVISISGDFIMVNPYGEIYHSTLEGFYPNVLASAYVYAFTGFLYFTNYANVGAGYFVNTMEMADVRNGYIKKGLQYYVDGNPVERDDHYMYCSIEIGTFSQYFNGKIHARVTANGATQICSSSDGLSWTSGSKVTRNGTVIGNILFYDDGTGINQDYESITYSKMPAIYVNEWFYAQELEEGYLMRSKDLINWQRYRNLHIGNDYEVSGYWQTKNLLCLKKKTSDENGEAGIYKYKIYL